MKIKYPLLICLSFFILHSSFFIYSQPAAFNSHGLGGGGAQYTPSINPANPSEFYVACDMGDLFHSTDGGNSWTTENFNQIQAFNFTQVQFTNNANILYCQSNNNVISEYFAVKSTNAGATWSYTTDPTSGNGTWYVVANPQNYNQVIVSDYNDLYLSNDGGNTFGAAFYTDTTGAGAYIAGTLFDGMNIYICTNIGLLISNNGGTTWAKPVMPGINGKTENIVSCAGAKSGNTTRFFCVTQGAGDVYVGETGDNNYGYVSVYSMDYGKTNWTKMINGISSDDLPFYVSMATNNIHVAYLAGNNNTTQFPIVLKTSDSGAVWTHVFLTSNNQNIQTGYCGQGGDLGWDWPQYAFGFQVCPSDTSVAVLTDEGFTSSTKDGGETWQASYVPVANLNPANTNTPQGKYYPGNGLEVTSTWDLMWYDSLNLFAGYTDITATHSPDDGNTWAFSCANLNNYNTVYKFVKNPTNGVIYAATSSIHDMYESTRLTDNIIDNGTGAVMYSTDSGKTFNTMHDFGHPVIWLALDPTNPERMYASVINHSTGLGGIWVSNDIQNNSSSTWAHCNNPARTQGHPFNIRVLKDGTVVTTFSGRINPSGKFTDSSGVFVSANQGNSWTDVSAANMKYWTMDLVIDPWDTAQNTWYTCVWSGWGGNANGLGGLYRTTNRGVSWTQLNDTDDYSITFDPVNKGQAYLTTEQSGLLFSSNIETSSPSFTQLTGYPFRQPNRVYFNPYNSNEIWVNSFGNGLRMGDLVLSGTNKVSVASGQWSVYPNPNNGKFTIQSPLPLKGGTTIEVYNVLGEKVYASPPAPSPKGEGNGRSEVNLSGQPAGVYLYKVNSEKGELIGEGKLIIEN
jgi:photosystem II stability/assembly factor-like uncharacterized protein